MLLAPACARHSVLGIMQGRPEGLAQGCVMMVAPTMAAIRDFLKFASLRRYCGMLRTPVILWVSYTAWGYGVVWFPHCILLDI
jgi:hypothetical protein